MTHRSLVLSLALLLGCAANGGDGFPDTGGLDSSTDSGTDSGIDSGVDSGTDGGTDGGTDAGDEDAGDEDAGADAGSDAGSDAGVDSGRDAGTDTGVDAGADASTATCPGAGISMGDTVVLDGSDDIGAYPGTQRLTPGGTLGASDEYAITWDEDYLYVTLVSGAYADGFKPVHIYIEAAATLGGATGDTGKEYSALTAELPFEATHLVAFRRTNVGGDGIPYNGVYVPGGTGTWATQTVAFTEGTDQWTASDNSAMSARVSWTDLGCPSELRITAHVVNAAVANEWKDFIPLLATPWTTPGGTYFEIDLTADPDVSGWTELP